MKTLLESEAFRAELPGWALRGVFCAANSAVWAVLMGFQAPAEIAGMVAGVVVWVVLFTAACAWTPRMAHWDRAGASSALNLAAWIKVGLSVGGWLLVAATSYVHAPALPQLGMIGMVDTLLGIGALMAVSFLAGLKGPEAVPSVDSFGWTLLTTLLQGFLIALVIFGLAVLVWLARVAWVRVKPEAMRSARLSG